MASTAESQTIIRAILESNRFVRIGMTDQDRIVALILGITDAKNAPIHDALQRITGLLEQLMARGASPQVIERVIREVSAQPGGLAAVEVTPELIGRLMDIGVKTNIDETAVATGESGSVDDAIDRLKRMQGKLG
jgi:hypothetical protein